VGLRVAFNDVDFCIKVRDAGYRNVLTPHAVLVHHESATRGSDNDESRRERFAGEQRVMKQRWGNALKTDPYYSPHLTLEREDFGL
jgi:O-antigen biosynthesis protein